MVSIGFPDVKMSTKIACSNNPIRYSFVCICMRKGDFLKILTLFVFVIAEFSFAFSPSGFPIVFSGP
jgi:hypothetical protein